MAFSEYKNYTASELKDIFKIEIQRSEDLFTNFKLSDNDYAFLQENVKDMLSRIRLSMSDNEATRSNLLVSHILWQASKVYKLGIFFEPVLNMSQEETPDLPHQLNGKFDSALTLDEIDFVRPIISIVEVKKSNLSEGLGQCLAEMYATRKKFKQNSVYGIITDGAEWEFLLLENSVLSIHMNNYYINTVSDIVDRIGYIAERFNKK
ncbi:MAG: hypothetical protein DRR08_24540 [Candidatus Parabeggiatoa sp. nov. 2]|nr:MAG: hypothetical protein DRR08_24540 [Gammaproteobacteria bacterium]